MFLEQLIEPFRSEALHVLRERVADVDGFIATSVYYADFMSKYLGIPTEKIHVVRLGIKLLGHGESANSPPEPPFVIGYLGRICPEKGLHLLVDAFMQLARKPNPVKLKVAGYLSTRDREYFNRLVRRIHASGLQHQFDYSGELSREQKIVFLNSLHVFSMPATYQEPKGLSVLEALANGVPVIQPNHGVFPEMLELTKGGILVEPNSMDALAEGITTLWKDANLRAQLGSQGKQSVHRLFSDSAMADATLQVFAQYVRI